MSVKHFIIFLIVVVCSCKTVKDNQVSEYPYHSVAENIEANIKNEDMITVTDMNTLVELKKSSKTHTPKAKIKRIDKTHYVDTETGEVKQYKSKNTKTSSRKTTLNLLQEQAEQLKI